MTIRTARILTLCLVSANFFLWNNSALSEDAEQKRKAAFEAYKQKLNTAPRQNTTHPYSTVARLDAKVEQLKTPIELPGIPQVPGNTQYVSGQRQDLEKETIYQASYNIAMPVAQAVDWYNDGLGMYNWKVTHKSPSAVLAKNSNGDYASVSVIRAVGLPKFKSNVTIYVRQIKSKR